jgi:hypothetical protein
MKNYFQGRLLYILAGLLILLIIVVEAGARNDFDIFLSASADLLQHKNIYQVKYSEWFHYYYDVCFALVLAPFTYLPVFVGKFCWLLLNVFFVCRLWKIMTAWLPLEQLNKKQVLVFTILSFALIAAFLRDNFHLGQLTIFILYTALEGLNLIGKNRIWLGSLVLALGIDIKLLPIVFVPYLLYRGQWRAVVCTLGFVVVLMFLPGLFIGWEYNNFLLHERWALLNPVNPEHVLDTSERSFHSLTTLLATLLVKNSSDYHDLTIRRHIADVSVEQLNLVINVIRGLLVMFTLYFLRTRPFKPAPSKWQQLYEVAYVSLLMPLIFPHQQYYAFFFMFPATTYLVYYYMKRFVQEGQGGGRKTGFIVALSLVFLLTSSHFFLGHFNAYYNHFKTLTYGAMILLVLLAVCRPGKIRVI